MPRINNNNKPGRNNNKNRLPNRAIIPTMSTRMPPILTSLLLLPLLIVSGAPAPHKKARGELKALEPYERDSNAVASAAEAPPQAGAEKKDLERILHSVPAPNRCVTRVDDCSDVNQAGKTTGPPNPRQYKHRCSTFYCAHPRCSRDSASTRSGPPHMFSSLAYIAAPHVEPFALRPRTVERGTPPPAQRARAWRHIDRPANRPFARRL